VHPQFPPANQILPARRIVFDANRAITTMLNGISATKPLMGWRDSSGIGKVDPSPTIIAIANHDARNAATTNGTAVLVFGDSMPRCAAVAAITACAAMVKMAKAKVTNAVPR